MRVLSIAGGVALSFVISGCGAAPEQAETAPTRPDARLAGRVQTVNKNSGFVLIRRYGPWKVAEHDVVESRAAGRTANLLPTGEKLGEHIAADIRSGEVEVGDAVYVRNMKPSTTTEDVELSAEVEN